MHDERFRHLAFSELGMRDSGQYRSVAFTMHADDAESPVLYAWRHLHHVTFTARSMFEWSTAAIIGDQIVCIVADTEGAAAHSFAQRVLDSTLVEGRAAVASAGNTAASAANSLRDVVAIVQLLDRAKNNQDRVVTVERFREQLSLARLAEHLEDPQLIESDAVVLLREHDETQGTDLVATLQVFLDELGSVKSTAQRLHVHENTVRYRLDRVKQLGVDLDRPLVRLWVWLRLAVDQLGRV